jgi:hypothetical protein
MEKLDIFYLDVCPVDNGGASFEEIYNFGICEKDYHRLKKNLFEIVKNFDIEPKELIEFKEDYLVLKKIRRV